VTLDPRLSTDLADRYRIERELGAGGMATVYLADDLRHGRRVAIKVLHPELSAVLGPDRFLAEIKTTASLQHPHILPLFDSGSADGLLFYVMPYVEGETLRDRLTREKQLPVGDAIRITSEVAAALDYAHRHGVIHRDIKPENIMLTSDGSTLVADFGIARALGGDDGLTQTGFAVGTPAYMSPEQASGDKGIGARTDIYSLGAVLYEMLAGEPPYLGASSRAILAKQLTGPQPRVTTLRQVPPAVDAALSRALARSPADRFESAAAFSDALSDVAPPATPRGRRWIVAGMATAAVLAALLMAWPFLTGSRAEVAGLSSAAVLPFADLSPTHDQTYFSDGLTEELTSALSRIPGFKVAARSSAFQFRGPVVDVREVGRKLGVSTVLEGSVRRTGDKLHVSAQLVGTRDGFELWSETYDRQLADVFAVQEEIARAIAVALRIRLTGRADSALVDRPTTNLEAYDLYLQGQFALNQRTEASLTQAVQYFEQAVARDSMLAKAWAGIADSYVLLPGYSGISPSVAWPKGKAAALRAIGLNPGMAEARTSLAYGTMLYDWDWPEAERQFRSAIAADSSYPTARHWYADFLAGRDRIDEALLQMRRAHELDPLSRIIASELAWLYNGLHRTAEADSVIAQALRLDPNYSQSLIILGQIRLTQQRAPEAVAALRQSLAIGGFVAHTAACLIAAYVAAGNRPAALALLDTLKARSRREYIPPSALALAYVGLGDLDKAFAWLNRGLAERDVLLPENFFEPMFDPLRTDPRYPAAAARLK